ncbi:serine/threonine-protein kinase [Hamadaea sp. NPDC051192]|uniref:serine/threonine-protein kinase n=1 Tax=Hamadaea sp. NPDC051192 TaxID=3154940 RepID=UPI003413BE9D
MVSTLSNQDPQEIGGYRLRARLGMGGMGEVYLAFLPGGRQALAIKVVRREYADDQAFRIRFAQEADAARRVAGPYIAPLVDSSADAPIPWLATAYVTGPTLLDAVRAAGPLPLPTVQGLVAAVATALQAIHSYGIVHRDLSPGNVVLAADGPKVIDFGIARATDVSQTFVSRTPLGTPGSMAPEVALGQPATPASDVFALGGIAYFAATGRSAYGDGTFARQLVRITRGEADLTGCPAELRDLVERCLAVDPGDRPDTAEIIAACGGTPRLGEGWLPPAITTDIAARASELARIAAQPVPPIGPTAVLPQRSGGRRWLVGAGVAAVVLAAAVLVGVKLGAGSAANPAAGSGSGAGPSASVSTAPTAAVQVTTTGAGTPSSAAPSASASASASAGSDEVRWTGPIRINGDGIDLDTTPPVVDPSSGRIDLQLGLTNDTESTIDGIDGGNHTSVAILPTGATASPHKCHELISTVGTDRVEVTKGSTLCFRTEKGLLGIATITKITGGFTFGDSATATVWATTEYA